MSLHADALDVLTRWAAPDERQEHLRVRYAAHLARHDDAGWRSCLPDHLTAGALVLSPDGSQVLLNLHGKAQRWFAFGGHGEPGDTTLAGVALREALEESGLAEVRLDPEPVHLDEHVVGFCAPGIDVHHLDVRFAAVADPAARHTASAESVAVRWWPVDALPEGLEPEMHELIARARARVAQPSTSSTSSTSSSSWPGGGASRDASDQPAR